MSTIKRKKTVRYDACMCECEGKSVMDPNLGWGTKTKMAVFATWTWYVCV